jgi:hypothetical protein
MPVSRLRREVSSYEVSQWAAFLKIEMREEERRAEERSKKLKSEGKTSTSDGGSQPTFGRIG